MDKFSLEKLFKSFKDLNKQEISILNHFEERLKILGWHTKKVNKLANNIQNANKHFLENNGWEGLKYLSDSQKELKELINKLSYHLNSLNINTHLIELSDEQKSKLLASKEQTISIYNSLSLLKGKSSKFLIKEFRKVFYLEQTLEEILKDFKENVLLLRGELKIQKSLAEAELKILKELLNIISQKKVSQSNVVVQTDSILVKLKDAAETLNASILREKLLIHAPMELLTKSNREFYSSLLAQSYEGRVIGTEEFKEDIRTFTEQWEFDQWHGELNLLEAKGIIKLSKQQKLFLAGAGIWASKKSRWNLGRLVSSLKLAAKDPLTRLYKRGRYNDRIDAIKKKLKYGDRELSVLMIDADDFKGINNTYGHPAGDEILVLIANEILGNVRENEDIGIRWGGDEFAVIFSSNKTNAIVKAEKIREGVFEKSKILLTRIDKEFPPSSDKESILEFSVTIGLASWDEILPSKVSSGEWESKFKKLDKELINLIKLADDKLVHTKGLKKKNRVVF